MSNDLISISACQRLLAEAGDKIARPTLSEYVKSHNLYAGGTAKRPLVKFEEIQQHRNANGMRSIMRGEGLSGGAPAQVNPALPANDGPEANPSETPGPNVLAVSQYRFNPNDPTHRRKAADAEKAEIELQQLKGSLVSIAEVEAGIGEAWSALLEAMASELGPIAEQLASEFKANTEGRRLIRSAIKSYGRSVQARMHDSQTRSVALLSSDRAGPTRKRLRLLTAVSHNLKKKFPELQALQA